MKKIYDPVHRFIHFNELEQELIDSEPFQRLHQIRQLGIAYLVYPGATHTRFEHSLGVMELTGRIFDRIAGKLHQGIGIDLPYWRQILRLAALCHDLGHLPFSHVAEHLVLGKGGHEKWTLEVIQSPALYPILEKLQRHYPEKEVAVDLIKMSLGEAKLRELEIDWPLTPWEKVMGQVVAGDFFGSDRIDYLLRDAQCTGVSYGLFDYHQLIETLCVLPVDGELRLGIEEGGIESCEALLLARHFMHKRVYQYPAVKAYSFHLARFMKAHYAQIGALDSLSEYLSMTDNEVLTALKRSSNLDARCLLKRDDRYLAWQAPERFADEQLEAIKRVLGLCDEEFVWSKADKKEGRGGLNFPVLTKQGKIVPANALSEIAVPPSSAQWIYIAPQHEKRVKEELGYACR